MKHTELFDPGALQPVIRCLTSRGINTERYLERNRIAPERVESGKGKILRRLFWNFLDEVEKKEGIRTLGFLDGDSYTVDDMGGLGDILRQTVSLKDAIDTFAKLVPTLSEGNSVWLRQDEKVSWLLCRTQHLTPLDCVTEHMTILALRSIIRLTAGESWQPSMIQLSTNPVDAILSLPELANCKVSFLGNTTGIAFPTYNLSLPIKSCKYDGANHEDWLQENIPPQTINERLLLFLESQIACKQLPNANETAEMLNCSLSALKRALSSEGCSYRILINRTRFKTARKLLEHTDLRIKEISYEIGYSHSSHFCRSFKRMSGFSPKEYRQTIHSSRNYSSSYDKCLQY